MSWRRVAARHRQTQRPVPPPRASRRTHLQPEARIRSRSHRAEAVPPTQLQVAEQAKDASTVIPGQATNRRGGLTRARNDRDVVGIHWRDWHAFWSGWPVSAAALHELFRHAGGIRSRLSAYLHRCKQTGHGIGEGSPCGLCRPRFSNSAAGCGMGLLNRQHLDEALAELGSVLRVGQGKLDKCLEVTLVVPDVVAMLARLQLHPHHPPAGFTQHADRLG